MSFFKSSQYNYFLHTSGQEFCSIERARIAVIAVFICTTIICIPNYLCYGVQANTKSELVEAYNATIGNHTKESPAFTYYDFSPTDISEPHIMKLNYWIHTLAIKLIPCILLTILTVLLIIAMHQAAKRRMKLKSQGKKGESDRARENNRTTGMLLAVVALFLLTEMPQGMLTLCSIFIPDFFGEVYSPLGDLLDIAALLNNSINFVLYCTMSRQFRDTFMDVFCGFCPKHRPGWLRLKAFHVHTNGEAHVTCATDNNSTKITGV